MKNRKAIFTVVAGSMAVALVALNTVSAIQPMSDKARNQLKDVSVKNPHIPGGGLHSSAPTIETTGFETPDFDAYQAGQSNYICGAAYFGTCHATPIAASCTGNPVVDTNCCISFPNALNGWFNSGSSQHCREPHIEIVNPATGSQHLRFTRDPLGGNPAGCVSLGTACRVNAFTPDMGPAQVVGPSTISWDIASNTPFGQTMEYFTVGADGGAGTIVYFYNAGFIYIYDAPAGALHNAGPWDYASGTYKHFEIRRDPCAPNGGTLDYVYDGAVIFSTTSAGDGTQTVERAIMETNNAAGLIDVDNYSVQRGPICPSVCGNGIVEPGEVCEPGVAGTCPPGRCTADCTCTPICTLNDPCILHNGPNGPFEAPFDPAYAAIFLYQASTSFVAIDTCGSTGADTKITFWGSANDPNDPGNSNDDCENTDQFGAGSDSNAACYNNVGINYESCTCYGIPNPSDTLYLAQVIGNGGLPPAGTVLLVNIEKKAACGQTILGSCCDSNGSDVGCTDDVALSACTGPDKSWSTKKCVDRAACVCVPNCQGRVCGSDGCGGSCGTCGDGNVCNGLETCDDLTGQCVAGTPLVCDDHITCNGAETCDPVAGCRAGTPLNCNDNNACTNDSCVEPNGCAHSTVNCDDGNACNGVESCNPASGCVAGTPINCDDGVECTVDSCDQATGACSHDDSHCFTPIPTVSQWGIAVMALLLLIGAKIYFSRRQSTTA